VLRSALGLALAQLQLALVQQLVLLGQRPLV
jgi:hypothetical protein